MKKDPIGERFVSHIWDSGHFVKTNLKAKDGRKIEVLYPGQWNNDAGADFHNASIKIDGKIYTGDVEVHTKNSEWRIHHHDRNPRYNNTILHVALWDGGISLLAKKQNGERIPNLILCDYLDSSIGKLLRTIDGERKTCPCSSKVSYMKPESLCAIIDRAGTERLNTKSRTFEEQLSSKGEDQILYEGIMEALGYSKNGRQFHNLAQKVSLESLLGQTPETIQAILFGVAGLFPKKGRRLDKETKEYLSITLSIWEQLASQFHDQFMSVEEWEFFRIRPDNFPTRRIAGMSYILSGCKLSGKMPFMAIFLSILADVNLNDSTSMNKLSRRLRATLMPRTSEYWAKYYTFGNKRYKENQCLIGKNRADDIIINVILPVVLAYSQKLRDQKLQDIIMKLYTGYPTLQDNKITRYFSDRVLGEKYHSIINSALRQQGLIRIHKWFCEVQNCDNCPFMEQGL
jgi:hypothetical protein